ncbi:entry/fusion complex component [Pteropox virus]|uniref:Entry-fusion complex protein OPG086 n=1 Tax=Pteropox virus TaxID=1873698 RepID=A0A1B1MRI2_9POXV|nr:entry/fusion complex component [Pteropox virus]ANS71140.1 entry/fusion complex component [Pteropox virus]
MTYCLLNFILFIIFVILLYTMTFGSSNKMQLTIKNMNYWQNASQKIDNSLPSILDTVIFQDYNNPIYAKVNATYDSQNKKITIKFGKDTKTFNLDSSSDRQTVFPILLLSK